MTPEVKSPIMIYTESTPNPETLKFVTNRMLYKGTADFREEDLAKEWSPLATALYEMPYVKGVYICNNFVTITKEFNYDWQDIMLKTKEFVKKWVEDGSNIINDGFAASRGIKTLYIEMIFAAIVAVVVSISIQWVGLLIINSLLILPAAAARNIAVNARQYHALSICFAICAGLLGLVISYYADIATGATIAIFAAIIFFITLFLRPYFQN